MSIKEINKKIKNIGNKIWNFFKKIKNSLFKKKENKDTIRNVNSLSTNNSETNKENEIINNFIEKLNNANLVDKTTDNIKYLNNLLMEGKLLFDKLSSDAKLKLEDIEDFLTKKDDTEIIEVEKTKELNKVLVDITDEEIRNFYNKIDSATNIEIIKSDYDKLTDLFIKVRPFEDKLSTDAKEKYVKMCQLRDKMINKIKSLEVVIKDEIKESKEEIKKEELKRHIKPKQSVKSNYKLDDYVKIKENLENLLHELRDLLPKNNSKINQQEAHVAIAKKLIEIEEILNVNKDVIKLLNDADKNTYQAFAEYLGPTFKKVKQLFKTYAKIKILQEVKDKNDNVLYYIAECSGSVYGDKFKRYINLQNLDQDYIKIIVSESVPYFDGEIIDIIFDKSINIEEREKKAK